MAGDFCCQRGNQAITLRETFKGLVSKGYRESLNLTLFSNYYLLGPVSLGCHNKVIHRLGGLNIEILFSHTCGGSERESRSPAAKGECSS